MSLPHLIFTLMWKGISLYRRVMSYLRHLERQDGPRVATCGVPPFRRAKGPCATGTEFWNPAGDEYLNPDGTPAGRSMETPAHPAADVAAMMR